MHEFAFRIVPLATMTIAPLLTLADAQPRRKARWSRQRQRGLDGTVFVLMIIPGRRCVRRPRASRNMVDASAGVRHRVRWRSPAPNLRWSQVASPCRCGSRRWCCHRSGWPSPIFRLRTWSGTGQSRAPWPTRRALCPPPPRTHGEFRTL